MVLRLQEQRQVSWLLLPPQSIQIVSSSVLPDLCPAHVSRFVDYYTWTRDSALTFAMLVDEFIFGNANVESHIKDYIKAQAILQTVNNPSGSLSSGRGLGEPKFYLNQTKFTGSWGRPQRDGPALRATAIIAYTKTLVAAGNLDEANAAWDVISNDLSYVGQYWNETGFDLWEEVLGSSFFATAVQVNLSLAGSVRLSLTDCDSTELSLKALPWPHSWVRPVMPVYLKHPRSCVSYKHFGTENTPLPTSIPTVYPEAVSIPILFLRLSQPSTRQRKSFSIKSSYIPVRLTSHIQSMR